MAQSLAPSPFFPSTRLQYAWDQTSLGLMMECPRKYQLRILEGWSSIGTGLHLKFGKHFADAMQLYHQARAEGLDHDLALDRVVDVALTDTWEFPGEEFYPEDPGLPWDSGDTKKSRFTLLRSIIWYFETYLDDQMKTVILPSGAPAVELLFNFASGIQCQHGEFVFTGHIDRLVDFDSSIFVLDNKTTGGALGAYYFSQFDLDNQMSQYTTAGRICYNVPVKGVVIDAAQIMVGFTAFGRGITMRSTGQLEEWHKNAEMWLQFAESLANNLLLHPEFAYPMNLKSCNNYGGCEYRGVCSKDPAVRDHFLKTSFTKRFWNPLETR